MSDGLIPPVRRRPRAAWRLAVLPLLALAGAATASADAPNVVASIKPVHSLVAGVMGDLGTPHLLVAGADSPHTYAFKPSDADALSKADVIFWIGDELEAFLERPIGNLSDDAAAVALIETPGLTLLQFGAGQDEHDDHDHDGEHHADEGHHDHDEDEDGHGHHHAGLDPHVWLDPENARVMVGAIAATLAKADPGNAATYQANAAALDERLAALQAETAERLAPYHDSPYYTFHESFGYFDNRFRLDGRGAISISPERQPGVQRLKDIRSEIAQDEHVCLFAEPQFPPKLIDVIVEGTSAHTGTIDPLGAALEPGADLYFRLIADNADAFVGCFRKAN
ncbi:zinc ABC transporter substrate-binding protein [Microbaculum marinum]|uniref:High-affinity zinc uptake system protein ZnuA n=1 Tax=Microbaculum marinum TaxID=1764581 RepID=A0AAW9S3Y9_9HYPH